MLPPTHPAHSPDSGSGAGFVTLFRVCDLFVLPVAIDHGKDKLQWLPLSARDHSAGDLAVFSVRPLSFRDVEDLLAERGIIVSYETVRRWVNHFGPKIAADLRKRRPRPHTTWHLDEVYLKIDGRLVYPSIRVSGFSAFSPILAL